MKKMFKMFGIALLACSLLTVACSKDEDTTTTTTTNNGGSNNNGGTPNPNPNPNPNPDPSDPNPTVPQGTLTVKWDNVTKTMGNYIVMNRVQGTTTTLQIDLFGSRRIEGDNTFVELPHYCLFLYQPQGGSMNVYGDFCTAYSEEINSDAQHQAMFTELDPSGDFYTFTEPDYVYVSHSNANFTYNSQNKTVSGSANIVYKSVYDERTGVATPAQHTLSVTFNNFPVATIGWDDQGSKKMMMRK